jgi:hypothetical protein
MFAYIALFRFEGITAVPKSLPRAFARLFRVGTLGVGVSVAIGLGVDEGVSVGVDIGEVVIAGLVAGDVVSVVGAGDGATGVGETADVVVCDDCGTVDWRLEHAASIISIRSMIKRQRGSSILTFILFILARRG